MDEGGDPGQRPAIQSQTRGALGKGALCPWSVGIPRRAGLSSVSDPSSELRQGRRGRKGRTEMTGEASAKEENRRTPQGCKHPPREDSAEGQRDYRRGKGGPGHCVGKQEPWTPGRWGGSPVPRETSGRLYSPCRGGRAALICGEVTSVPGTKTPPRPGWAGRPS